jgi:hypothetical protein
MGTKIGSAGTAATPRPTEAPTRDFSGITNINLETYADGSEVIEGIIHRNEGVVGAECAIGIDAETGEVFSYCDEGLGARRTADGKLQMWPANLEALADAIGSNIDRSKYHQEALDTMDEILNRAHEFVDSAA